MSELVLAFEKVKGIEAELERLAALEVDEVEEARPFGPDWNSMRVLNEQGIFQVLTARVDDKMVGYFSWLLDFDLESKGTLIVNQMAWFIEKGYPIVAMKMLNRAISEFEKIGVQFAYFHHTVHGRGAGLGKLFERKGAKLLGYNYVMRVRKEGWKE